MSRHDREVRFRITGPDGQRLVLAEQLLAYLDDRVTAKPFVLGEWLEGVDENCLQRLLDATAGFLPRGAANGHLDAVSVLMIAIAAELGRAIPLPGMPVDEAVLRAREGSIMPFVYAVRLEHLRRQGVVRLPVPLSITRQGAASVPSGAWSPRLNLFALTPGNVH